MVQLKGIVSVGAFTFIGSLIIWYIIKAVMSLTSDTADCLLGNLRHRFLLDRCNLAFEMHLGFPASGLQWAKRIVGWGVEIWLIRTLLLGVRRRQQISLIK